MRTLLLSFTILGSSLFCECVTVSYSSEISRDEIILKNDFHNSEIIFYGKSLGERNFEIIKLHRGKKLEGLKIISEKEELTTCDDYFEKNKNYLVFGYLNENNNLVTSHCNANKQISEKEQQALINKYL